MVEPTFRPELGIVTNEKLEEIQASMTQTNPYMLTKMTESNFVLGYLGMFAEEYIILTIFPKVVRVISRW